MRAMEPTRCFWKGTFDNWDLYMAPKDKRYSEDKDVTLGSENIVLVLIKLLLDLSVEHIYYYKYKG